MLHCHDCFHSCVCGSSSPYNDVDMCKQFVNRGEVLCGAAYKIVTEEMDRQVARINALSASLKSSEIRRQDLEREVELLRIIKQTLEMQSGMKFDI